MLLEALERPGVTHLHASDLMELAEAKISHQGAPTTSLSLSRAIVPESPLSSLELNFTSLFSVIVWRLCC